jgi:hypothetical protein
VKESPHCATITVVKLRIVLSIFLAVFFALVFRQTCFTELDKVRLRLLDQPVAGSETGTVLVRFETTPELRKSLQFLALSCFSTDHLPHNVLILLNTQPVSRFTIPAGEKIETVLDISRFQLLKRENKVKLQTNKGGWTLEKLEVKNMRAFSTGLFSFFVVNKNYPEYSSPIPAVSLILGSVLCLLGLLSRPTKGTLLLKATGALFFAGVWFFNALSPYMILIALQAWMTAMAAVYLPELRTAYTGFRNLLQTKSPALWTALKLLIVHAVAFAFFCCAMLYFLDRHTNYSGFLYLSEKYIAENPLLKDRKDLKRSLDLAEKGYDGQFMYTMTFDPFLSRFKDKPKMYLKVVDNPPYRYARIGYPLLTKIFSLDRPELYPKTMIYLILASHLILVFFLVCILRFYNRNPFLALLYALIPGFLLSLMFGLPESIAAAFLMGGFWFYLSEKRWAAAAFLAASVLVRETGLLMIFCLVCYEWWKKKNNRAGLILACSVLPYMFWRLFLAMRLFKQFGARTFYTSGNLSIPFSGLWEICSAFFHGQYPNGVSGLLYALILLAVFLVSLFVFIRNKNITTVCLLAYSVFAVSLSYRMVWAGLPNGERVTYEVFLFLLAALATPEVWRSKARYAILGLFAVLFFYSYFFASAADCFRYVSPLRHLG